MKTLSYFFIIILAAFIQLSVKSASALGPCGNPKTPSRPPNCQPCPSPSPDPACTEGGTNHFDVFTGNVHRQITDIMVHDGVGEHQLKFQRTTTSRYLGALPTPLGTGGSWRHNYLWNIYYAGTNSIGNEIISVDYPDGNNYQFDRKSPADLYLTGVSETEERVQQDSVDLNQYYLLFTDGSKLSIRKIAGTPVKYQANGLYDRYGQHYPFTLDAKGRVTRVTEPAGRYINISYGSIGNFAHGNITFSYYNATATNVGVAGEFNGWQAGSNPMVNNNGTWTTTIPLQFGAAYQYKFVVDGTWVSDPANWNTVPPGGPSTENNSLVTNNDKDLTPNASVPVTFTHTSATATTVFVAGQFNNWSQSANPLTKNGSTWTTTIPMAQGSYQYKFVVNGVWMLDPANPFTAPDGYGGYNSKLAVGPLDEGITQVQTSDGRFVTYSYSASASGFAIYSTITQVNYGDGTHASYTYTTPFTAGGRPVLASADDPRYELGKAGSRIAYTYQNTGVDGFVHEEKNLSSGSVIVRLTAVGETSRTVLEPGTGATKTYTFSNYQQVGRSSSAGTSGTAEYADGGYGLVNARIVDGKRTSYERTAHFGVIKKTILPDLKFRSVAFADETRPFYPSSETDELGGVTTYTRDPNNKRVTRIDYPDQTYETFGYNGFGQVTSHRLRTGYTETATYDLTGRKLSEVNAAGEPMSFTYNAARLVEAKTDGRNNITRFLYNDRGQIARITNPDHTDANPSFQSFEYDNYGNRTRATNELGKSWIYSYDDFSRLTAMTNPLTRTTEYSYDGIGGCGSCNADAHPTLITLPSGKKTKITYNDDNRKIEEIVGFGTADAALAAYEYDGAGNVITMIDPRQKSWTFIYDNRNRRTRATDPNGNYTEWTYNGVGQKLTEKRSSDAAPTTYFYDVPNRLVRETDPKAQVSEMTFDGARNMLTLKDARVNTYTFTYDGLNRKKSLSYPGGGGTESWVYDEAGNLQTHTTRAGQIETITSDTRNRETQATWSNNAAPAVTKTYDKASRLLTTSSSVSALSYGHNNGNQLTSETQQIMADGGPKFVSYTYDLDGNRATAGYPSASSVSYGYTNRNQLNSITATGVSGSYTYDLNGNPLTKSLGNSTSAAYGYDNANRVQSIAHVKSGNTFSSFAYSYNNTGTRAGVTREDNFFDTYNYDAIDQVTGVSYNARQLPGGIIQLAQKSVGYAHDAVGNRTSMFDNGTTTNYSANNLNQYSAVGTLTPTYDANGNMTGQGSWSYTYDAYNRVTSAFATGTTLNFAYDTRNRCVSRTINGVVTFYYYDGWNLIEEQNAANTVLARYVHGAAVDEIIAAVTPAATTYYHHDALGSTAALTDTSGNLVERYAYDIFGAPTITNSAGVVLPVSAFGNRFLFTGREWIKEVSVYDYRNRVYSSAWGRFLQTDPLRFGARDTNLYRYVSNNVTGRRDPTGLRPDTTPGEAGESPEMPWDCAGRIAGEVTNQREENTANPDHSWREQHCETNCRISRECAGGKLTAWAASYWKEYTQDNKDGTRGWNPSDSPDDMAANKKGRDVSGQDGDCACLCKGTR